MKMKILAALLCILIIPVVIAKDLNEPGEEIIKESKATLQPPSRRQVDFKNEVRTISVKPSAKKTLTRQNFHAVTKDITQCRKKCIDEFRTCHRPCSGKTSQKCSKSCKNTNNACYDKCTLR